MINLMGKRYWYFVFSLFIIIPGIFIMVTRGLPLSIDFKGGTLMELKFNSGQTPPPAEVISIIDNMGIRTPTIYTSGKDLLVIRSAALSQEQQNTIISTIEKKSNDKITIQNADTVGPTIGREVTTRASLAVLFACIALVLFITFSFRGVQHAWRYGICTILALVHDVLVILSIVALGSLLWEWQVDTLFLTALMTVIAFSAQDTIVVFDRLRENSNIFRRLPFETLANHSVVQSITRSINTQLMTVDFMLLALALFGGVTLREFAVSLLVGMISGSYSSVFIAAPLLIIWENKEWQNWFGRRGSAQAA